MKNLKITIIFLLILSPLVLQSKELYQGEIESGFYGSPLAKFGKIMGENGYFVGAQGGWIINHRLVLGMTGYILANPVETQNLDNIIVGFGCGGLMVEYILASDSLIHISLQNMFGIGGVYNDIHNFTRGHDPISYTGDAGLIIEPGVNVMFNVTKNFRIGVGISYRHVDGVDYDAGAPAQQAAQAGYKKITDKDLSGVSGQITFKVGLF